MRQSIKDFIAFTAVSVNFKEPVYEFGSFQVEGQEDFADLRYLFPEKEYIGCDMRKGPGVDKILNLHHIDLPNESVGTVLCLDTLEHVEYPHKALLELYRILSFGGVVIISSVMDFPIHDHPYDFWRFTPEAFKSILKPFSGSFVGYAGDSNFPHTIVGIGFKGEVPKLNQFKLLFKEWQLKHHESDVSAKRLIKQCVPPILFRIKNKLLSRV